jgi:hypothetical protein
MRGVAGDLNECLLLDPEGTTSPESNYSLRILVLAATASDFSKSIRSTSDFISRLRVMRCA